MTSQVARADALHCPNRGVKCRDDRSAFFSYDQVTDQIETVNVSCARLIEQRAIAVEVNTQSVQEVSRGCASQREYHTVEDKIRIIRLRKTNPRSSPLILDLFNIRAAQHFNLTTLFHRQQRIVVLLIEPREICLAIRKRHAIILLAQILNVFSAGITSAAYLHRLVLNLFRPHIKEKPLFNWLRPPT